MLTRARQMRMGKGKGSFDHWAARVAVSQIVFELKGMIHEAVARDAMRLAGNKLPGKLKLAPFRARTLSLIPTFAGQWEFVRRGEPPVVGITKLDGVTLEDLKRPRRQIPPAEALQKAPTPTGSTGTSPSAPA